MGAYGSERTTQALQDFPVVDSEEEAEEVSREAAWLACAPVGPGWSVCLFVRSDSVRGSGSISHCTRYRPEAAVRRQQGTQYTRNHSVVRNGGVGTGSRLCRGSGYQAASSEGSVSQGTVLSTDPCGGLGSPFVF